MLLATDLDGTFLGGSQKDKLTLYRMIRDHNDIHLLFVTGRGIESVMPLLNDAIIPNPDYVICDVGATVLNGRTLEPIQPIQSQIEKKWPGQLTLRKKLKSIKGLTFQEIPQQRRCSFFYNHETDIEQVKRIAAEYQCDILLSAGQYLDILPQGVNKGSSLVQLVKLLNIPEQQILVAGDTFNDFSLFQTGYKGVVVKGAEAALIEETKNLPQVFLASKAGAGGILESLQYFPEFRHFQPSVLTHQSASTSADTQLLVVYHRLPYDIHETNGIMHRCPPKSPNGIIPSLLGIFSKGRAGAWIAWEEHNERKPGPLKNLYLDEKKYPNLIVSRIPLTRRDVELFYKLFSKEAFWPTIFSFIDKAKFNHEHWKHFVKINRSFAEKTAREADANALVWIHDYNLWMVPAFLRMQRPDVKIGFFHHTAFPPADIFNIIPWRKEIVGSLLQCDYIGFHIPRYVENFIDVVKSHTPVTVLQEMNCATQFLTYSCALGVEKMTREIDTGQRRIRLGAHPVGINTQNIQQIYEDPITQEAIQQLQTQTKGKKIIVSIERLDYVKGPLEKIHAYGNFLDNYPEFHGKVELINICTPPAQGMKIYESIQSELERAIGKINGKYSRLDWVPIRFFFRSLPFEEVVRYYTVADIAWITPLRDGLNLVAKEYVATQGLKEKPDGVLLLSEFAGASVELQYALLTNPYDSKNLEEMLLQALTMDEHERILRMKRLHEIVTHYDIEAWSTEFIGQLAQNG